MPDLTYLLPDSALTRFNDNFQTDEFLQKINSPLRSVVTPGGPASVLIDQVAREFQLDARVLLTRLQVEQSLLFSPATPERLDWAMGYGVPDSGPRDERYRGFANQLRAAAATLKAYLEPGHPLSVVDLVGKTMQVSDGTVVPANRATAALYRYTPWRGDKPFGSLRPPWGAALFATVWEELFGPVSGEDPDGWRVIAPPDRWRDPLPVTAEVVAALQAVAERLGLHVTTDPARQKLYLGLPESPQAPSEPPGAPPQERKGPVYPSGYQARLAPPLSVSEAARYTPAGTGPPAPLIEAEPEARLSEHFTMGEFLLHDPRSRSRYVRLSPALVALLEKLRHELGDVPLQVTSGYRDQEANRGVGGASRSVHMDGLAADVYANVPFAQLAAAAERVVGDQCGLGLYPGSHVHVDLRGARARWP